MKEEINLEEILDKYIDINKFGSRFPDTVEAILKAMQQTCLETLELAADNAELNFSADMDSSNMNKNNCSYIDGVYTYIDKQLILNLKDKIK